MVALTSSLPIMSSYAGEVSLLWVAEVAEHHKVGIGAMPADA